MSVKYAKYLERQERDVGKMQANQHARIPPGFDYASLPCLSTEEVEKLSAIQPTTIEAASAIPGITPKALLYLFNELQAAKWRRAKSSRRSEQQQQRQQHELSTKMEL